MRFPKTCRVWKVAAKEASRYSINGVFFDAEAAALVATDGRHLAVVPVDKEETDLASAIVPLAAVKAAQKPPKNEEARILVECNGDGKAYGVTATADPLGQSVAYQLNGDSDPERFPDWQEVIPKPEAPVRVAFNARYLLNLQEALGADSITLELDWENLTAKPKSLNAVKVLPTERNGERYPYGVIMPIEVQG